MCFAFVGTGLQQHVSETFEAPRLTLVRDVPANLDDYERYIGYPIQFNSLHNEISTDQKLDTPLVNPDLVMPIYKLLTQSVASHVPKNTLSGYSEI